MNPNYTFAARLENGTIVYRHRTEHRRREYITPDGRRIHAKSLASRRFAELLCLIPGQEQPFNLTTIQASADGSFVLQSKSSKECEIIFTLADLKQALQRLLERPHHPVMEGKK